MQKALREDAVLEAGQEDHRELQALRGVQGHQRDHALGLVAGAVGVGLIGDLVGVGDQRDPLEEVGEPEELSGVLDLLGDTFLQLFELFQM